MGGSVHQPRLRGAGLLMAPDDISIWACDLLKVPFAAWFNEIQKGYPICRGAPSLTHTQIRTCMRTYIYRCTDTSMAQVNQTDTSATQFRPN